MTGFAEVRLRSGPSANHAEGIKSNEVTIKINALQALADK